MDYQNLSSLNSSSPQYTRISLEDPSVYNSAYFPPLLKDFGQTTPCKVLICVTIYNEDSFELQTTLKSICENIENMQETNIEPQTVGVVLIQDGLEKLHRTMNEFGRSMGLFDPDFANEGDDNTLHCFASQFQHPRNTEAFYPKFCVFTGIKHKNKGKLNSHKWFFKCIAQHVNPKFCVLIDCGTIPEEKAIHWLVEAMQSRKNLGGVCGEIRAHEPKYCKLVIISQDIEYRVSHFMDKCMESLFGFVTVLPGAFCAYRWKAINGEPLDEHYFYALEPEAEINCFKANMYLAEDRVLGAALVFRRQKGYLLYYVEKSKAYTDVPTKFGQIMQQRRRWINGSWFALLHSFRLFLGIKDTSHNLLRKFLLALFMVYQVLFISVTYLTLAVSFIFLHFVVAVFSENNEYFLEAGWILRGVYIGVLLALVLISIIPKSGNVPLVFKTGAFFLIVLTIFALALSVVNVVQAETITYTVIALALAVFVCIISSAAVHGNFKPVMRGILQYVVMLPCYVNVYLIYAFCNVQNVTWGLRNDKESNF